MAHPGPGAASQPHYHPQSVPAPPQQPDDVLDCIGRMAQIYQQLARLDPEKRFPLDLIHILVKVAACDPVIAQEVNDAVECQLNPPPAGDPRPSGTLFLPSSFAARPSAPAAFPAPFAGSAGAAMAPAASRPPPAAAVAPQVPAARGRKRAAPGEIPAAPPPPSGRMGTDESTWMAAELRTSSYRRWIRRDDNPSEEEVDRRLARLLDEMVEEQDIANGFPKKNRRSGSESMRDTPSPDSEEDDPIDGSSDIEEAAEAEGAEAGEEAMEVDDAPEPREKPANYDKLLDQTKKDLGWTGKYNQVGERREKTMAYSACVSIGERLERLARAVARHRSYANRLHALTVMRDIYAVCLQRCPHPTRAPWTVRNCDVPLAEPFVEAVRALTPDQRRRVRAERGRGGLWMEKLVEVMGEARRACSYPKLHEALILLDHDRAREMDPWTSEMR